MRNFTKECLNIASISRAKLQRFIIVYEVVKQIGFFKGLFKYLAFTDGIQAATKFSEIRDEDPFCLDAMDVYSNVLYVQINQPELAQLAHQAFEVDKYRVETCCIVGKFL